MFNISEHMVDENKRRQGVWVNLGGGSRIKVASSDNPAFKKRLSQLLEQNEIAMNFGSGLSSDEDMALTVEAYVDTVLIDWENIATTDKEGSEVALPFNRDNALMAMRQSKSFRDAVINSSAKSALFKKRKKEAIVADLKKS